MEINYPPYTITDKMSNLATKIMEKIGEAVYDGNVKFSWLLLIQWFQH